jgi:ubiquinone/menaquinone biosynthesis C-methylase UbiE
MQVDKETWTQATKNLIDRRERGTVGSSAGAERIRDYAMHLSKVYVGQTLLDIGCGAMHLKDCVPEGVQYAGMDAFPVNDKVAFPHAIEDSPLPDNSYDTVCAFAVLDNCLDFDKAIANMKRIAARNVVILTGVDIEVDKFHTFKLQLEDFDSRFSDWKQGYRENLATKVWLLEYKKP